MTANPAIVDLLNRINSNTLTVGQQQALSEALTAIEDSFPTPDELSSGLTSFDEADARAWIASLYAIQAEFNGGTAVLPTMQTVWHINNTTGSNTNDGLTSGTAIKDITYLATLWKGTVGGGRPQLNPSTGTTITVFLESDFPSSQPLALLLDVDIVDGAQLIFQGQAKTAAHTGTLATASTFAQTSAGGQQTITDGTVADYSTFVGAAMLMQDSTTGGIGWLYAPDGSSSATGMVTRNYTAQTPGNVGSPIITPDDPSAGDAYTLSDVVNVTLGEGWLTRTFPDGSQTGTGPAPIFQAEVFLYRIHFVEAFNSGGVTNSTATFESPTAIYAAQECLFDGIDVRSINGSLLALVNCLCFRVQSLESFGTGVIEALAGGLSQPPSPLSGLAEAATGGIMLLDRDFLQFSADAISCDSGLLALGAVARFSPTPGIGTLFQSAGQGSEIALSASTGGTPIVYGTDSGNCFELSGTDANLGYSAPLASKIDSSHNAFTMANAPLASSFGFDQTTGAFVGPTTLTTPHVDAALAATTGFGGNVVDPTSGCTITIV